MINWSSKIVAVGALEHPFFSLPIIFHRRPTNAHIVTLGRREQELEAVPPRLRSPADAITDLVGNADKAHKKQLELEWKMRKGHEKQVQPYLIRKG